MAVRIGTIFRILLLLGSLIHLANGARPLFDPPDWTTVLPEVNTTAGTIITRFTATDADGDNISYSLQSNAHPWFRINSSSGVLTVNKTLDREAMGFGDGSLRFKVYASDGSTQGSLTAILTITDVNDYAPVFQNLPLTTSIAENTPTGFTVATATATDADATTNAVITFAVASGNVDGKFRIDQTTGEITIAKPLEYDNGPKIYTLNISAMNNHTDIKLQSFGLVIINVLDLDDLPANFSRRLYEAYLGTSPPPGSLVIQVQAEDMDSFKAPIEYSIYPESDPDQLYAINPTTGIITVNGNLNKGVYSIIVNAFSTKQPPAFTLVKVVVGPDPATATTTETSTTMTIFKDASGEGRGTMIAVFAPIIILLVLILVALVIYIWRQGVKAAKTKTTTTSSSTKSATYANQVAPSGNHDRDHDHGHVHDHDHEQSLSHDHIPLNIMATVGNQQNALSSPDLSSLAVASQPSSPDYEDMDDAPGNFQESNTLEMGEADYAELSPRIRPDFQPRVPSEPKGNGRVERGGVQETTGQGTGQSDYTELRNMYPEYQSLYPKSRREYLM